MSLIMNSPILPQPNAPPHNHTKKRQAVQWMTPQENFILVMDQWLVLRLLLFLSRIFLLWIINIFLSTQLQNQDESPYLDLMEIWKFWSWEYAEARWDWVFNERRTEIFLRRIDWVGVQNTHFVLPGHVITSFHLPLGRGMDWALANGIRTWKMYQTWSRDSFLHDLPFSLFLKLCLIDIYYQY